MKKGYHGKEQHYFLCDFLGSDSGIDVGTEHPEFRDWKWIDPDHLPELIVPFKRDLYRRILQHFADYL